MMNWDIVKKYAKKYFILLFSLFVAAINFNLFLSPLKIVTGGLNGVSILTEHLFGLSPSISMLIFSILTLIIGFIVLGIRKAAGACVATFVYPLFVNLTVNVANYIDVDTTDLLMVSIFTGVITGFVSGSIVKAGSSQGGVTLISQAIAKIFKISISKINFFINTIIVVIGGFVFGFDMAMYAIIVLFISSIVMNRILLGISNNKFLYIHTTKKELVKDYIFHDLGYGITEFEGISGDTGDSKEFLMTVVPTSDYVRITEYVKKIDSGTFFVVTDSYQTSI